MSLLFPFLVIAFLIFLNGLFVAAEFAIIGVRPSRLEQLAEEGSGLARRVLAILRNRARTDRYIATAQLGITLASLGLGMYAEPVIAHLIEGPLKANFELNEALVGTIGFAISLTLITYLHVVLGEMIPKSLALSNSTGMALRLDAPMRLAGKLFIGPVLLLNGLGVLVLRLFGVPPPESSSRLYSPDELELIVSESAAGGLLEENEYTMVANIFDFTERKVHQVMTPRPRIEAVPLSIEVERLLEIMTGSHYTRLPVYAGSIDNIVGVMHIKDLVRQQLSGEPFVMRQVMRPPLLVPESLAVDKLLARFRREHGQMAIVLDEHGGTAGLVTMEDLIEEVVGEVHDEFDEPEPQPLQALEAGRFEVDGSVLLDDLREEIDFGRALDDYEVETVGGLVMAVLGRPAEPGDVVETGGLRLEVLAVQGLSVERVLVEKAAPPAGEPDIR